MWLPTPSENAIKEFAQLFFEYTGEHLTESQAKDLATRVIQIYYLKEFAYRDRRS
jgi:hypothetical protein